MSKLSTLLEIVHIYQSMKNIYSKFNPFSYDYEYVYRSLQKNHKNERQFLRYKSNYNNSLRRLQKVLYIFLSLFLLLKNFLDFSCWLVWFVPVFHHYC